MEKGFEFYAYNPPTNGEHYVNGVAYRYGEDFRNVKRYKEYLDCGFTMLQVRYENAYNGEEWETSNTKLVCDEAYKAGVTKLLITDSRIDRLITSEDPVGEGKLFATENELDAQIKEWVAPYKDVKGFYGLQLLDEPTFAKLKAYGRVARSLKRVLPDVYLQCNLLPFPAEVEGIEDKYEAYKKYIETFFDETEQAHVCMDEYPFRREYIICGNVLRSYPIIAEICKTRNKEFHSVLQSMSWINNGKMVCRRVNESDMYWQTNLAMGFGVRQFAWYTYMPKASFRYEEKVGGDGVDGACFLNHDGSKTKLYHYTRRIMAEMQKIAPILLKYKYENAYIATEEGKTKADFDWTMLSKLSENCPFPIRISKGVALITEHRQGENRLFMIENISNVKDELFDGAPPMQVEFSLPDGKKSFYFRGKKIKCKQENTKFLRALKVGDAIFVEIKK